MPTPTVGATVNEWTVLSIKNHHGWCRCSCGTKRWVYLYTLGQDSQSCGHLRLNDGRRRAKLHRVWLLMIERCHNPQAIGYSDYGGRGIHVTPSWKNDFERFYRWSVAHGYTHGVGLQIDRRNNDGPYSPSNCRWVTALDNARNKRNTVLITAWGETRALTAWLEDARCNTPYATLWWRIKKGWTPEEAISTPPR